MSCGRGVLLAEFQTLRHPLCVALVHCRWWWWGGHSGDAESCLVEPGGRSGCGSQGCHRRQGRGAWARSGRFRENPVSTEELQPGLPLFRDSSVSQAVPEQTILPVGSICCLGRGHRVQHVWLAASQLGHRLGHPPSARPHCTVEQVAFKILRRAGSVGVRSWAVGCHGGVHTSPRG